MRDKRGSILVFAMWALVFLTILNVALYEMVASHLKVTKRFRDRILCPYLAMAAYRYARVQRKIDETPEYDTLYELREEQERTLRSGTYTTTLVDEESKININKADRGILSRLPGMDESLADEILASELRPFHAIEELFLVEDITDEIFLKLKDFITVHGKGWVNINTAPSEVLAALDLESDLIGIIEEYRGGPDGQVITADDRIFKSDKTIIEDLRSFRGLYQGHEVKLKLLIGQGMLQVTSGALSLKVQTEIRNNPAIAYTIVMEDDQIKRWREE